MHKGSACLQVSITGCVYLMSPGLAATVRTLSHTPGHPLACKVTYLLNFHPIFYCPSSHAMMLLSASFRFTPSGSQLLETCPWHALSGRSHGDFICSHCMAGIRLNDVGLLCGCGCRHAYFYWVLALQASYRAWRATRTVQPCWLPAHI